MKIGEENLEHMVISHDKHLDRLTTSVETLADSVGSTNRKLDDVIEVISAQNVMVERMNNMDVNMKEFAVDMRGKIKSLEETQSTTGCTPLKVSQESISGLGRSLDTIRERVEIIEDNEKSSVSGSVIRWGAGLLVTIIIVIVSVASDNINALREGVQDVDKTVASRIATQIGINNTIAHDIEDLERRVNNLEDEWVD